MSMAFNYTHEETGQTFTWVVRFADAETFEAVQSTVAKALFEEKNGVGGWAKLKVRNLI